MTTFVAAGNVIAAGDVESRITSKLRRRPIPLLLDRINIGFAALTMNTDLAITSAQFGLLIGIFFWGHFIFEVPSNLLLHKMGGRIWIARILVIWGARQVEFAFVNAAIGGEAGLAI
jgi:MFS transporter, ACS family, tartrate transporter